MQKLKHTILALVALLGIACLVVPASVTAVDTSSQRGICEASGYVWDQTTGTCSGGSATGGPGASSLTKVDCANGQYLVDESGKINYKVCCPTGHAGDGTDCVVAKYINPVVKLLSVAAGIAVVIGIIMGGIQYSASAGDPQKAAQAKGKITKALFGLVGFLFLYSALQFFSPGGISTATTPTGSGTTIAEKCSRSFLGLKPWFNYLPDKVNSVDTFATDPDTGAQTCNIENFSLLGNGSTSSQLLPVFLAVADDLIRIAGLVAVAFVITGGIQFVTSQGEPEKTKQARGTIINALIGVAVAIIAAVVVSFIGSRLSA